MYKQRIIEEYASLSTSSVNVFERLFAIPCVTMQVTIMDIWEVEIQAGKCYDVVQWNEYIYQEKGSETEWCKMNNFSDDMKFAIFEPLT